MRWTRPPANRSTIWPGDLPHFASPTLGGNRAYLGTLRVIAVSGALRLG
jgi:hypothetical protein